MANTYTYRHSGRTLQKFAVDSATVIEIGDAVWLDTDDVKPASDFAAGVDLATTQANFAAKFLGIAAESSAAGQTDDINVDTSSESVYEVACTSGTYEVGDPLAPAQGTGFTIVDQTWADAVSTSAVARCYKRVPVAATAVEITVAPAYVTNSSNVNANVG